MKPARVILNLGAAILSVYGLVFFFRPATLGELVGLAFTSPNAPVEIRSFYGGLELGIAAFLFACARRDDLVAAGLLFCSFAFAFAGAARLLGILQYGFEDPSQPLVGVIEIVFAGSCAWMRRRGSAPA